MDNSPPTTHRISEFHKWEMEARLDLAPPFQRKPVWSEANRSYLIDTIVNQLPVPEIYMQVKTDRDGNTRYVIVDGQQRIRAILDFIKGEFTIEEEDSQYNGKEFKDLPDGVKTEFWDYSLVVRELKTSRDDDVRAIFRRLNKNVVPLNPQELRNGTYTGHFIKLMNELADDPFLSDYKIVSPSEIRRMRDAEFISELFVAMIGGISRQKENLDEYYQRYDAAFTEKENYRKQYASTLSKIIELLPNLAEVRWRDKTNFYSLFVAITNLLQQYYFPPENYKKIGASLNEFMSHVITEGEESKDGEVKEFAIAFEKHTNDKEERLKRDRIIRALIIPHLVQKDKKRDFNEEERLIMWNLSKDKKCAICKKVVEWKDYALDHIDPHSKGGKTLLENSQITHKKCNSSKGNRR